MLSYLPIFDILSKEKQEFLIENKVRILGFKLKHEVICAKHNMRRRIQGIKNMYSILRPGLIIVKSRMDSLIDIKNN